MGKYPIQVMSSFLTERKERLTPDEANALNIKRIEKIDFSGQIHLADNKPTKTRMIIIKKGDLVISGINVAKGALAVYDGDEDVIATIHYSAYSFDTDKIDIEFLKWFVKSPAFVKALQEQTSGGIKTEIKAKKFLALKIPMPPLNDQQLIASRLNEFEQKYKKIQSELQTQSDLIAKLRSSILSDAVSGRLVPQDPTDEPAGVLLERIKAEKERLVKERKIKKPKPLPPISNDEIPYELSDGWVWCRLDDVCLKVGDVDHKMPHAVEEGIPYVSPKDFLKDGTIDFFRSKKISIEDFEKLSQKIKPNVNDIIFPRYGTIGENVFVQDDIDFLVSYSCAVLKNFDESLMNPKYVFFYTISPLAKIEINRYINKTTQPNIGVKSIKNFIFPLPPLNEQHRIVAKVEKLMVTCDQLEAEVQKSRTETNRLMQTVLKEAFAT